MDDLINLVNMLIGVVFILIIFLLGCIMPVQPEPTELPDDFEITSGSGAMHLAWGSSEFHAKANREATYTALMGMAMKITKNFNVTKEELFEIYKIAIKNNFFSLNDQYEDPFIMDGGWEKISITADGSTKTVLLLNYHHVQFDAVDNAIYQLVNQKLGAGMFGINFHDYCDEKKIGCDSSKIIKCAEDDFECEMYVYECEEWIDYCK